MLDFNPWDINYGRPTVVNEYQGNSDDGRDFPSPLAVRFLQSFELALVLFGVDGAGSHDCRIFPVVRVVAFPDSHRFKSLFLVKALGDEIGNPDLQCHYFGAILHGGPEGPDKQKLADSIL